MITRRQLGRSLAGSALLLGVAGAGALAATTDEMDAPPNVFISPCGEPFRAPITDPYPVAVWFKQADKNGDGKLDRTEFKADAAAFFRQLDANGDGMLDGEEISYYEKSIAPGESSACASSSAFSLAAASGLYGGRLWKTQGNIRNDHDRSRRRRPGARTVRPPHDIDESGEGAAPYSFFAEPEPVMGADENLNGLIRLPGFLHLADRHFDRLDPERRRAILTLDKLPKTQVAA